MMPFFTLVSLSQKSEVRPSLAANTLAEKAALEVIKGEETNPILKDAWINLGNQLEIDGVPKVNIPSVASELIRSQISEKTKIPKEEIKLSGYFYRVYKQAGWSSISTTEEIDNALGRNDNSSINTKNAEAREILVLTKSICDLAIKKLQESPEMDTIWDKKETREFYRQWRTIINNCKYAFDEKTKVPENTEQILLECLATSSGSMSEGAYLFMDTKIKFLKNQGKSMLTSKQGRKFQLGDRASQLPLLKPLTRDEAVFLDYFGVQCKCNSWRVRLKLGSKNVECYDCNLIFAAKTVSKCRYCQIPLYKENLLHIVKTDKCENCNTEIILPQELTDYANS